MRQKRNTAIRQKRTTAIGFAVPDLPDKPRRNSRRYRTSHRRSDINRNFNCRIAEIETCRILQKGFLGKLGMTEHKKDADLPLFYFKLYRLPDPIRYGRTTRTDTLNKVTLNKILEVVPYGSFAAIRQNLLKLF